MSISHHEATVTNIKTFTNKFMLKRKLIKKIFFQIDLGKKFIMLFEISRRFELAVTHINNLLSSYCMSSSNVVYLGWLKDLRHWIAIIEINNS